ncbi:MAG: hypothetical protein Q9195_004636 [Heterodermia aff. obscurata]
MAQTSIPIDPSDPSPIFFHKEHVAPYGFLSQWFLSSFHDPSTNTTYNCAEQRMMHQKALLFNDTVSARDILATQSPSEQKVLGRKIKGWDDKKWDQVKFEVVVQGTRLKFHEDETLRGHLLATAQRELVEASPRDRVWGIGCEASFAEEQRAGWGMNLLGKALMTVREEMRGEMEGGEKG